MRRSFSNVNLFPSSLVFISAFLLFVVQPMAGKELLPRWGGSASVWTACLLFFQLCLLIGYATARLSVVCLSLRGQTIAQGGLMISAALWLLLPWRWQMEGWNPALSVLTHLGLNLGLPAVALSSASPIASHWMGNDNPADDPPRGDRHPGLVRASHDPYYLYAISNAGSLLGCVAYPFFLEPWLSLPQQQRAWGAMLVLLALGWLGWCTGIGARHPASHSRQHPKDFSGFAFSWLWLLLPWSTAVVLAAATQQLSQAGVVVPGLWVAPLSIYLVTWWLAFSDWGPRRWGGAMALFYIGGMLALLLIILKLWLPWVAIIAGYSLVILCTGLACHATLYELRPPSEHLTAYYFAIALGGAMGTASVLLLAPRWFNDYYEMHIGLSVAALALTAHHLHRLTPKLRTDGWVRRWKWPLTIILPCMLVGSLWTQASTASIERSIEQMRDFYGVVRVVEDPQRHFRAMVLGQTIHGVQPLDGPLDVDQSMYYGSSSGVALAWGTVRERTKGPLRVGTIGLGTGTMSLYATRHDQIIYYEISPAVRDMAQKHFQYLSAHQGRTDIRIGDGRTSIATEVARGSADQEPLDLLLIDAFTNDSIPMHLLTVEAFQTYRRRLNHQGWIAINITNRNLDLAPTLFATAQQADYQPVLIENAIDFPSSSPELGKNQANREGDSSDPSKTILVRWLLCMPSGTQVPPWPGTRTTADRQSKAWTDSYGSLLQAFRR